MGLLPPVRIEIKPSKILKNEIGVFSVRPLKKDSVIVNAEHFSDMRVIKWEDFNKFDSITKKKIMSYCPGTPEGFSAPADLNYISIAWHLNHSCNPNVGFNGNYDFVAMRSIKKGEELCWDYSFDETNPKFKMKCSCGSNNCRGLVTGNDWKLLVNNRKIIKYLSPKLLNLLVSKLRMGREQHCG